MEKKQTNLQLKRQNNSMALETARLYIRHFQIDDIASCFRGWGNDVKLGRYILGYPMNEAQMNSFIKSMVNNENAWVIVEKESNECIGYVTLNIPYIQLGVGEIGYVIGEKWQGNGYAYESMEKVIKKYLVDDNIYLIEAKCIVDNKASMRLLQKLGFSKEGILRGRRLDFKTGNRADLAIYSITIDDLKRSYI